MSRLLIVDDEQSICWGLSRLAKEMGHKAETAATAEEGLQVARQNRPDAIILDVRLPGMDGLDAMQHFHDLLGPAPIIVITAHGDLETAVEAVRNGAFDYLTKPFDLCVAQRAIERALRGALTKPSVETPTAEVEKDRIVGQSSAIQEVFKRIALVSPAEACVHLRGESGTGKELAARAIHRHSRRCKGPFVVVNLASLNETLAESELFGHLRGAFTGAEDIRKGLLEQADGGTVFLDEVADIPPSIQIKLLRALEHGEILPVGASQTIRSDFRVISATHQNLAELVADGLFRHDLYYRLITFEIEMPPLRERREDIDLLVDHFLNLLAAKGTRPRAAIAKDAADELRQRPWNGNVRELRNAVEHATVLERDGTITVDHLPAPAQTLPQQQAQELSADVADVKEAMANLVRNWAESRLDSSADGEQLYEELMELVEPPLLEAAMQHYHNQCATAARRLGLHRTTLRKKLDQFGL